MQNFSPEALMQAFEDLKAHVARHVPVGEGTETDLQKQMDEFADRVTSKLAYMEIHMDDMADRLSRLEHEVLSAAGTGPTQDAGLVAPDLNAQTLAAENIGVFTDPAHSTEHNPDDRGGTPHD